jgi:rSAM/selenodomain-associated transferase 2
VAPFPPELVHAVRPAISIIIPVLNEAPLITTTLAELVEWRAAGAEVIVVDGGSDDDTVAHTAGLCDQVLTTRPGRAAQMNAGAAIASGRVLLFLHADCCLPSVIPAALTDPSADPDSLWGRFDVRLDSTRRMYRIIEFFMNQRSRLTYIATGDQAIFVGAELFTEVGGYPPLELMEDVALSAKLKQVAPPVCLEARVRVDVRRWERAGVFRTMVEMWCLRAAFALGASPRQLRAFYYRRRLNTT